MCKVRVAWESQSSVITPGLRHTTLPTLNPSRTTGEITNVNLALRRLPTQVSEPIYLRVSGNGGGGGHGVSSGPPRSRSQDGIRRSRDLLGEFMCIMKGK